LAHIPSLPETAQLWHDPQGPVLQQTPSVQCFELHSPSRPQARPSPFLATQPLPLQYVFGWAHWVSSPGMSHVPRQPPVVHWYGEQLTAFGIVQLPVPLQAPAGWKVVASRQVKLVHIVPAFTWAQAPPAQKPVLPQGGFAAHRLCGSAWPSATAAHVPGVEPLQVLQVPQLEVLQQTPSTQLPLAHSWAALHALGGDFFGWQDPPGPVQ
jgi:hypothetical protein